MQVAPATGADDAEAGGDDAIVTGTDTGALPGDAPPLAVTDTHPAHAAARAAQITAIVGLVVFVGKPRVVISASSQGS
ncbi:hypothetical protein KDL01_19290 [Actinospica durhamensis]|uniref:Uncharacterized protein n=1 Tax=Actinospica durhamensis TaxID=1508375 RepID=A0A941ES04_9ACTN|nr:hypothetical protein [Actinospica durhamensis]MBR7835428.1 hypothetical protein [Actinospica durhamensis]